MIGVLTAKDMEGTGSLGRHPPLPGRGGKALVVPHRPALAAERVVHIGEPVVMIVAESVAAAQDAAETRRGRLRSARRRSPTRAKR